MRTDKKQKLQNAIAFVFTFVLLTAMLTGAGLLGEKWRHERAVEEAKQIR